MDEAAYVLTRFGYLRDEITEKRARELFEDALARGAVTSGDLSGGFRFWRHTTDDGVRLVRCRVERLPVAVAVS
jgi:hypothetical protein